MAVFESNMFWQGELSRQGRLSEDSEEVQVLGLDGAESRSEFGWSEGELLLAGVVSEREGLEWEGVMGGAELGCAEEDSGESSEVKRGGILGGSVVWFCILLD